ncbi:PorP/SprF family type IX secretion system membrane protein [Limibacter armeniacum]|uniref:PorP/SprF family type IX secretion system membrane protein n=1 Tax=Limibacter armeniacum TaxID=466084 RepID=UPI002FE60EAD
MPISLRTSQWWKVLFLLLLSFCDLHAQDPQFSQFYAAPLYLNPALTGSKYDARANVNYRNQWVDLPANFQTTMASFDHYLKGVGISVGALVKRDQAGEPGNAHLIQTSIDFSGAYLLKVSKNLNINFGLQLGVLQTSLGFQNFIFSDQISSDGTISGSSQEHFVGENVYVPEIASGMLVIGKGYWAGVAMHHMNQPSISFLGQKQHYPYKLSVMGGYVIPLEYNKRYFVGNYGDKTISPVFLYTQQGKADQLSLGAYLNWNPFILGMWYRGIPGIKKNESSTMNQDAIILMTGFKMQRLSIGYSIDLTLSDLPQDRALSHEISIAYDFKFYKDYRKKKRRKSDPLPCPVPWVM